MNDSKTLAPSQNSFAYAKVAINRPIPQPYTYYVPESMSGDRKIGSLVQVPLRNEKAVGVIGDLVNSRSL